MRRSTPSPIESHPVGGVFATTRWSVVLRAGDSQSPQSDEALESLCQTYWPPLYSYVRRRGYDVHEAQDLIQDFVAQLLERRDLGKVQPAKGKFRSFLLASMNNFLANEWNRAHRQKRGGGRTVLSLDEVLEDHSPGALPMTTETPEKQFERQWAETVIKRVLQRLRQEWECRYQPRHFDEIKTFLVEPRGSSSFATVAEKLGMTESAMKSLVHRLRKRYRELFHDEIAHTVSSPEQVDDEIRHLITVLAD